MSKKYIKIHNFFDFLKIEINPNIWGSGGTEKGKKLWKKVKNKLNMNGKITTDYWKPYKEFIPRDKHVQSKVETYTVE